MCELPLAAQLWQPGTWVPWIFGPSSIPGAAVTCPGCGRGMSVGGGQFGSVHAIECDGVVRPSLACGACSWHVFVRLVGWTSPVD